MIQSMTGFGKATVEHGNKNITVEIKSLNGKQADISTRIPSIYRGKEIEIRNMLLQQLLRGKIDITINTGNSTNDPTPQVNLSAIKAYDHRIGEVAKCLNIPLPENRLELLLHLPEVFKPDTREVDETEWTAVSKCIAVAMERLQQFRRQEGEAIRKCFEQKIENIQNLLLQVEPYEKERIGKIKTRLEESLQELSEKVAYDKNRLEQELIYYVEKLDVNEEKARLGNHLSYFLETMNNEQSPGKKLGFIAQEIGREVNTLGSKANHSEIQKIVVLMKDELEQIKEQVLNVL